MASGDRPVEINSPSFATVLLDLALDKELDYAVPASLVAQISPGVRVEVPVRGKPQVGTVLKIKDSPNFPTVQSIQRVLSEGPILSADLLALADWMARYYSASLRDVLQMLMPATVRKGIKPKEQLYIQRAKSRELLREHCEKIRGKTSAQAEVLDVLMNVKEGILLTELLEITQGTRSPVDTLVKHGWLHIEKVRIDRSPLIHEEYFKTRPKKLTVEQDAAFQKIKSGLHEGRFETHLILGVTGSGKTEIYLQSIQEALSLGKGAIMLVPEISLTAQTIERFRSRFEGKIAILHHRLSNGERYDEWMRIRKGEVQIVIGARSAIFSPLPNLGLIIVDEEHETSYKQSEDSPCYHARDVAVMRGKLTSASVILGSATPSLESYHNALSGKYTLSKLTTRADSASVPKVTIVDMKREFDKAKSQTPFSEKLLELIKDRQSRGEQTILFLNRRGYHSSMLCTQCQHVMKCQHCDVSLTFHLGESILACHVCGYSVSPPPKECPSCHGTETLRFKGVGTELIERSLHAILPEIRTLRVDRDTTRHKGSHQRLLREFASGKADVMIGTQMIAKGLHFPQVTLVGVLNSDAGLHIPDYRASEVVFQLITQVAGRSGRGAVAGEVIIQTCMPENSTIQLAAKQDFEQFYQEEIISREMFKYPPFNQLVKLSFSGLEAKETAQCAENIRGQIIKLLPSDFAVHPVIPSGHAKVKDRFRFQFLICGPSIYPISQALRQVQDLFLLKRKVKMLVDVNPISTTN